MRIDNMKYGMYSYQNQQKNSVTREATKKSPSSADISISSAGREISQAKMTEQAEHKARVQELKQLIADGNYKVDSSKVAEKLISFWSSDSK
ncbi:flagellar biosynthesis anti-sigma factor FlgM [Bacillus sp. DNRA2]|uniref:flagellar biosynthesis anti-sigma factor FlgM n=1 Tax=Bacillus sp. DNRA2 TaxID=2723053 RepID=UPI00145CBB39|nr:flagellar biosynthesis anti-sigma factor FlgM [Bacillus sp. DNRA2]NMD69079.1 flagellar biosynthesis anti-sigma factor FlgM [Bacillus sp. DNRA2]